MLAWLLIYFAISMVILPFTLILLSVNKTEHDYDALALAALNEADENKQAFNANRHYRSFKHSHTAC